MVDADRRRRNLLAQMRGEPTGLIDATPIRAHVAALASLGYSAEAIASVTTGTAWGLRLLVTAEHARAERKWLPLLALPLTLAPAAAVPDTAHVPALGATRRVRALLALGWRHADIEVHAGRRVHAYADGRYPTMRAGIWRDLDRAYAALSGKPGPSDATRRRAEARGYPPPLAWDDVDDPGEQPTGWRYRPATAVADRAHAVAELLDAGEGLAEVCRRLETTPETLRRSLERAGRWDLWRALNGKEDAA